MFTSAALVKSFEPQGGPLVTVSARSLWPMRGPAMATDAGPWWSTLVKIFRVLGSTGAEALLTGSARPG